MLPASLAFVLSVLTHSNNYITARYFHPIEVASPHPTSTNALTFPHPLVRMCVTSVVN